MKRKKIVQAVFFPNIKVIILLLPLSVVLLTYAMMNLDENDPIRIASYVLAFYTLSVSCLKIPKVISFFKTAKKENKYIKAWFGDVHLRMKISLTANTLWNTAYAALQLGMGVYHKSPWFYSLAGYYMSLAIIRLILAQHTLRNKPGEKKKKELIYYCLCGWIFLLVNLTISVMMLYMLRENPLVKHNEITTIALATYTFVTLTLAIVNVVKYRKYNSPVYSASKAVSLACACVSMITLENTMLTIFDSGNMPGEEKRILLCVTGGAVSLFIITMAIAMIVKSNRALKSLRKTEEVITNK